MQRSVGQKSVGEECCRRSVVEKCRREVLQKSFERRVWKTCCRKCCGEMQWWRLEGNWRRVASRRDVSEKGGYRSVEEVLQK